MAVLLAADKFCLPMQVWPSGGLERGDGTRGVFGSSLCSISLNRLRTHRQAQGVAATAHNRGPPPLKDTCRLQAGL